MIQLIRNIILISFLFLLLDARSQECNSSVTIKLVNRNGGFYSGQKITLTNKADGKTYIANSDNSGEANLMVPCGALFEITISNFAKKKEIQSPKVESGTTKQSFTYEPDMIAKVKSFEMSAEEKKAVELTAKSLADTIFMKGSTMVAPANPFNYSKVSITIQDIENNPLSSELVCISGKERNKNVKGTTDRSGHLSIYLPKGDTYFISFKYNKNFKSIECPFSKGISTQGISFNYLGTKEIERRKKEEAIRLLAEEKRIKEEERKFALHCKKLGITIEEGKRREIEERVLGAYPTSDTVVSVVLNRNKWFEKLIVCDLTGSMSPYAAQLALWYKLSYLKEKNLQFIFFNDGDNKRDGEKKIGATGGIYYSPSKGIDSLFKMIGKVSSAGGGGDCPENNMEALIKGVKMASPYKELVMIADNNAPVKDIELLEKFNLPVHIILCGVYDDYVLIDYLNIAWKTKGSIHTMEQDITGLVSMMEGQEIKIGNIIYRIMGGEFVRITKI